MPEVISSGSAYAYDLLVSWQTLAALGKEFRFHYLQGKYEKRTADLYRAEMLTLWLQLLPKVEKRSEKEFQEIEKEFMAFKDFYLNPRLLVRNPNKLFELEMLLRRVMEKLKITVF